MSTSETSTVEAIEQIGKPVAARIDTLLASEIERWSALDSTIAEPLQSLRTLVAAGGKRLRPAFCYWAFVSAGGSPEDRLVVDAGAALELLHSFALIHDDVMDDSAQRRGADAVHVEFAKAHIARNWRGEHRRFGEGVAILVGDMSFVYADVLMADAPRAAVEVFNEMRVELNVGQYLDISATVTSNVSLNTAQMIASYKSGKYTVERPMHLGAALAGRYDELAKPFSAYGVPVGEAFQLRDDLLGAFGDESLTGKPVGGDLREGKPTALYAMALERAKGAELELLRNRYGAEDLTDAEVVRLQEVLTSTGARNDMQSRIDSLVSQGLEGLEGAAIEAEAKQRLVGLAYFVAGRQH